MSTDAYLGNPNLKKVNTPVQFTEEQILEYQKCANDPLYFMEKYIQIVSLDEGLIPFKLYDFQKKIVKTIHENRFPELVIHFAALTNARDSFKHPIKYYKNNVQETLNLLEILCDQKLNAKRKKTTPIPIIFILS